MNVSTVLARLAVEALGAMGVAHVVLCPGSRSAPLAYALTARSPRDRPALHVRHDERVAAFTALGVARGAAAGGTPGETGAVVTTSGTAAANLMPAVLEAHHANVSLVVVTADRPPALRGTWANQTSELQAGLFGDAVRARLDLADTDAACAPDAAWAALVDTLQAAWGRTRDDRPGPVHLDLGFTDPLVPDEDGEDDEDDDRDSGRGSPAVRPGRPGALRRWNREDRGESLDAVDGTVVVAGDGAGWQARRLAEAGGWPLLAEPSSGARSGPNAIGPYRLLLELPELGGAVRRAVVLGRPTLSRPVTRLLARSDVEVVLVSPFADWPEPGRPVRRIVGLAAPAALEAADKGWYRADPDAWLSSWLAAGAAAQDALDALLGSDAGPTGPLAGPLTGPLTGPLVAREVAAALSPGELLVAAASNPIRDLDLAARPFQVPVDPTGDVVPADHERVVANRGLAGIDGTLSTAMGAALARDPDPGSRRLALPSHLRAAAQTADRVGSGGEMPSDPTRCAAHEVVPPDLRAEQGAGTLRGDVGAAGFAPDGRATPSGRRVRVLIGDLAFLHDANALLADPARPRPDVQVVVLNDDGGGIFSLLEHGERAGRGPAQAAAFERVFGTPHGADLAALCRGYGVRHTRVDDVAGLQALLASPPAGTSVVEVRAVRGGLRDLHAAIRTAVHAAARAALTG